FLRFLLARSVPRPLALAFRFKPAFVFRDFCFLRVFFGIVLLMLFFADFLDLAVCIFAFFWRLFFSDLGFLFAASVSKANLACNSAMTFSNRRSCSLRAISMAR